MKHTDSRFNIIAQSYEYAIAKYPDARTDTDWLLEQLNLQSRDTVLEIAAGTGYLTKMIVEQLPHGKLYAQDIAPATLEYNKKNCKAHKNIITYELKLDNVPDNSCDKAVSLGGWHHIENQIGVAKNALNKLKKGGIFCVGDFADNSGVQRYFDEVIDKITLTGHQALFPSESRMINIGRFIKASGIVVEAFDVPFYFDSKAAIGEFFQRVHALEQDPQDTYNDIAFYYKIKKVGGRLAVMMPYVYAKYIK